MDDKIFWGNLIGILKRGQWNFSGGEALAFAAVMQEAERRSQPLVVKEKKEPVKKEANANK